MEAIEIIILSRSLERITSTLIGGGAIYMAFKLFLQLPNFEQVTDTFRFRKYLSFHIVKIGMGTIFMLFGAIIVLCSFFIAPIYQDLESQQSYSGFGKEMKQQAPLESKDMIDANTFPFHFSTLNDISSYLDPLINDLQAGDIELTLSRVKLNLMLAIWDESRWGDPITFKNWINKGAILPASTELNLAALQFFNQKL